MPTKIDKAIAEALQELAPDMSKKPYPASQDTYICDLMYHALHCWSCGWTGAIFDLASLEDMGIGILFTPKTESICPQCGKSASRVQRAKEAESDGRRGLRLV
jgi:hypothetical protein